jgi:hypothetical protein
LWRHDPGFSAPLWLAGGMPFILLPHWRGLHSWRRRGEVRIIAEQHGARHRAWCLAAHGRSSVARWRRHWLLLARNVAGRRCRLRLALAAPHCGGSWLSISWVVGE